MKKILQHIFAPKNKTTHNHHLIDWLIAATALGFEDQVEEEEDTEEFVYQPDRTLSFLFIYLLQPTYNHKQQQQQKE